MSRKYLFSILFGKGEYGAAIETMNRAAQAAPRDRRVFESLARAYERKGDAQKAEECRRKAADLRAPN